MDHPYFKPQNLEAMEPSLEAVCRSDFVGTSKGWLKSEGLKGDMEKNAMWDT